MPYTPLQLAEAYIRTGELDDALEALNSHLDIQPDDDDARRLRAAVLLRMPEEKQRKAALIDLDSLTQITAEDWVQRSIIWQMLGDWGNGNAAMEQAHGLKPEDERITERYLLTLEKSGQVTAARTLLDMLPKTWRWLQIAGDLARGANDDTAGLALYSAALADLDEKLDTVDNPFAANLKAILLLKSENLNIKSR